MSTDTTLSVEPGDVLADRFEIVESIGSGGHGHVLLATHIQLGYPVAIKLLDAPEGSDFDVLRERFRREAILGARVRSSNVAQVLEAGELEGGQPFLVMELVDGPSLAEVLSTAPLTVPAAVDLAIQLAGALCAFDAHQIVHRDIKPSNIVLQREPDGRVLAKLVDLGISRVTPERASQPDARLTQAHRAVGTPLYMAPEQVEGTEHDRRTDLYSLCVVLFECLAGRPPFVGHSPASVLARALSDKRPRLGDLNASVPMELAAVVERGLRLEPDERWQEPRALAEVLKRFCTTNRTPRGEEAWRGVELRNSWDKRDGPDSAEALLREDVDPFVPTRSQSRFRTAGRWALVALLLLITLASAGSLLFRSSPPTDERPDTTPVATSSSSNPSEPRR